MMNEYGMKLFQKILPKISNTEREALDAGTVWWESELFGGRPNWDILLNTEQTKLTQEEHDFINSEVDTVCEMVSDWEVNVIHKDLPVEVWDYLKDNGFFALNIKKEYGGLEFSAYAQSCIISILASRSISLAITTMVPNSLGPGELLYEFGTQEQKDKWLPTLSSGKDIPAFALTGPYSGSDAAAMEDYGVVEYGEYDGEKVLGIRLNWEKRYITLGPVSTLLGVACHIVDPDELLKESEHSPPVEGISLVLVPTDTKGVRIGRRHYPARQAFMNGPNYGKDVFLPLNHVIGGIDGVGKGWRMLMACLAAGRAISLPSLSMAGIKHTLKVTTAYSKIRKQFKIPISKMEGIEEPLSRIIGQSYVVESACNLTTTAIVNGEKPSVISAMLKYQCTERMRQCIIDGMDILAGKGISDGPNNLLLNYYITQPIANTVEGANILTRSLIVFSQGSLRCHPFIKDEVTSAECGDAIAFNKALMGHLKYTIGNIFGSLYHNITGGMFISKPKDASCEIGKYYKRIELESKNFALLSDISISVLGADLKKRQRITGRFADAFSELYMTSAVLKRYEDTDDMDKKNDILYVTWGAESGLYNIQKSFEDILDNYPSKFIGFILRRLIFPFGRRYKGPSDKLNSRMVKSVVNVPNSIKSALGFDARSRLTDKTFTSSNTKDALNILERAYESNLKGELDGILEHEAIMVDDFDKDLR